MDTDLICALRENARRVLTDRCASDQLHRFVNQETDRYDAKLWRTAAELGWLALAVTEEHGGLGAGIVEVAALQEELGRFLAPVPFHSCALVARALALWPRDVIRAEWLPRLATGEIIGAVGPFFPSSSSLTAVRSSSAWKIKGECAPVLDGEIADVFLVSVSTEAGPGIALIGRSTGLAVSTLSVADRTRTVATLRCQNIEVPADHLLCGSEAAALSDRLADEARILIASDSLGGAQAILDTTVEYLKARVQFGRPIGSFQALKHRCADHKVSLEANKRLLGRAMLEFGTAQRATWTSLAKFSACDCYAALAADGVQMHGGIGFTWEHNAHLFLKRALLNQFLFGDSAQQQDRAAQLLIAAKQPL